MKFFRSCLPVALLVIGLGAGCGKEIKVVARGASSAEQLVEVVPLVRRDLVERLTLVGSIAARESADIRAETAGVVRTISFEEGGRLTAGQVLLKIDDTELQAQLQEAEATLRLADANLVRIRSLVERQTISQADFETASAQYQTALARAQLQRSRAEKTTVRAPFDGIAGGRKISPGDYVSSQSSITTINDVSRLKIEFEVPEAFLSKVKPGTTFSVTSRATPDLAPIKGEVFFVNLVIDRDTRSSTVKGWLTDAPADFRPGMFANVNLILAVKRGALVVPESSLLVTQSGMRITVVDQKGDTSTARYVAVTPGMRSGGYVEIMAIGGGEIVEGQSVVASGIGAVNLPAGKKLKLMPLREELRPMVADEE